MSKLKRTIGFVLFLLVAALSARMALAQGVETAWSIPRRLSNTQYKIGNTGLTSDQFGYSHIFWSEGLPDGRSLINYSRFDGGVWSVPVSIYISPPDITIKGLSPNVDQDGILHLFWTEGIIIKDVRYMRAPVRDALSATKWNEPVRLSLIAEQIRAIITPDGTRHILITRIDQPNRGVFYTKSTNAGVTWTTPVWLDPDIPSGLVPDNPSFAVDDRGGLHALWGYGASEAAIQFRNWIRYANLAPGETDWTRTTVDRVDPDDEEAGYQLNAAGPVLAVSGNQVVIIWAGGTLHYRHFRFSDDYGETWSNPVRVFGELNGQATDGISVDGAGRIHYFAQIRFPVGIYHTIWDGSRWSAPSVVYFIRYLGADSDEGKVEAHFTIPTILSGSKIVLTFTDEPPHPKRGLYVMTSEIADLEPVAPLAIPEPPPSPTPVAPTPTATSGLPEATSTPQVLAESTGAAADSTPGSAPTRVAVIEEDPSQGPLTTSNTALVVGMAISLVILVAIVISRALARR